MTAFLMLRLLGVSSIGAQTVGKQASGDTPAAIRKLNEEAMESLSAGKFQQALQKLERAYAAWPSIEGIYRLGRVAEAQGRSVAAADFYRRYLAAAGLDIDEHVKMTLRQYISSLKEPTAEVDVVTGDNDAFLRLDGELAGVLPLSRPLLVNAGEHHFTIEKEGQAFQTSAQFLSSGQRAQLQVSLEAQYAVLTLTPALVLLVDPDTLDNSVQTQLFVAVAAAAKKEHAFLIDREQISAALINGTAGQRVLCAENLLCQESLAHQLDAAGVLTIKAQATESHISQLVVQLLDVSTGVVMSNAEDGCASCSPLEAMDAVLRATRELLQRSATRGRGALQVASILAGARVLVDGRELGKIPFLREAFEGIHELTVLHDGYNAYRTNVQVTRGQTAQAQAALQKSPEPVRTMAVPPVSKRWRFIVGGITVGAGLIFAGFGAAALAANGSCVDVSGASVSICQNLYATNTVGSVLVGAGSAPIIGGIVMMAWRGN